MSSARGTALERAQLAFDARRAPLDDLGVRAALLEEPERLRELAALEVALGRIERPRRRRRWSVLSGAAAAAMLTVSAALTPWRPAPRQSANGDPVAVPPGQAATERVAAAARAQVLELRVERRQTTRVVRRSSSAATSSGGRASVVGTIFATRTPLRTLER